MRIMTWVGGLFAALAAAGCAQGGPENAAGADAVVQGNEAIDFQAELAALPEGQRNGVFIRAIRDAGLDCQHVESSQRTGEHQGQPVWNVRCAGGGNWTIVVGADGTASVLNASEAQLVGGSANAQ